MNYSKYNRYILILLIIIDIIVANDIHSIDSIEHSLFFFISFSITSWLTFTNYQERNIGSCFYFGVLTLLFNPFFILKPFYEVRNVHGNEITEFDGNRLEQVLVFVIISLVVYFFVNNYTFFKETLSNWKKKLWVRRIFYFIGFFLILISLMFFINYKISQDRYEKEQQIQLKEEKTKDSLNHIVDSIKRIEYLKKEHEESLLLQKICTSEIAIENFHDYFDFYYPNWKIAGEVKVKKNLEKCSFDISTIIKENGGYSTYPLILTIYINSDDTYRAVFKERPRHL